MRKFNEPWKLKQEFFIEIVNSAGDTTCRLLTADPGPRQKANLKRIIACVNALAGIDDVDEFVNNAKRLIKKEE